MINNILSGILYNLIIYGWLAIALDLVDSTLRFWTYSEQWDRLFGFIFATLFFILAGLVSIARPIKFVTKKKIKKYLLSHLLKFSVYIYK